MSGALNPLLYPQEWDVLYVGGIASPGYCQLSEFKRAHEWDIKKGKGTLGATITFIGKPPAKGSIEFFLWTEAHFYQWDDFRTLLKYDPTKKQVQAFTCFHPSLNDIEINQLVTENIGAIEHKGQQLYSVKVDFLEYFPPPAKPAVGTPSGVSNLNLSPSNVRIAPPPPVGAPDADQQAIQDLLQKAGLNP